MTFLSKEPLPSKKKETERLRPCYIYNQYAQEFFRSQYEADNEEAAACRKYAERTDTSSTGRWDKDFCRTFGLGYSPARGNKFLQYAKDKGLNLQILVEIGLLGKDDNRPGNYYDFYRGWLMIPNVTDMVEYKPSQREASIHRQPSNI